MVLKMMLHTAKKARCWRIAAVLAVFLGLQLSRCGKSSELQNIFEVGRDFEVLFECSSTVWVQVGLAVVPSHWTGTASFVFVVPEIW